MFEKIAGMYHYRPEYPREMIQYIAALASEVPRRHPFIDVGAGTCLFTSPLSRFLEPPRRIIAVEPSAEMRKIAALSPSLGPNVRVLNGVAERLPFRNAFAGGVFAACAYHRFPRQLFLKEASRVLRAGGLLAVVDHYCDYASCPVAASVYSAMEKFVPSYRRGWHSNSNSVYEQIDTLAEICESGFFTFVHHQYWSSTYCFSPPEFFGYCLSLTPFHVALKEHSEALIHSAIRSISDAYAADNETIQLVFRSTATFAIKSDQ